MIDWWSETEHAVVDALASAGPMSPQDLARRIGMSEGETIAYLCMLARERKVAIQLVDLTPSMSRPGRPREQKPMRAKPAPVGGY